MKLGERQVWMAGASALVTGLCWLAALAASAQVRTPLPGSARPAITPPAGLPLYFETNCGQASIPARFLARGRDYQFLIQPTETRIVLRKVESTAPDLTAGREQLATSRPVLTRVLRMAFAHANEQAQVRGLDALRARINYLVGDSPEQWHPAVETFARVCVEGIYPGVNLVYYGNQQQLEYDFDVAPGANPEAIAICFEGADRVEISDAGELVLKLGADELRQPRPILYQMAGGVRQTVGGGYRLLDPHTVGFAVAQYDRRLPLVIDPVLSYSTYFGGGSGDIALAVGVDAQGFVYVAGETLSTQFVTNTPGAYTNFGGGTINGDAFVAKFSNDGSNLVYFTYLGGSGNDGALGLAVDAAGHAYVAGFTDSPNFPIVGSVPGLSTHINGTPDPVVHAYPLDGFVAELNTNGTALVYSAYLGGSDVDVADAIAVDPAGSVYLTGYTRSIDFPTTNAVVILPVGATNTVTFTNLTGSNDVFVVKIAPGGSNLIYSTYYGGSYFDVGEGIAADTAGRAYVTGYTMSTNFPASLTAPQPWLAGEQDAFLAIFGANGGLLASTYFGGSGNDVGFRVAVDGAGNAYVTGSTVGSNFPLIPGNLAPGGVFVSSDSGADWSAASHGLLHNVVLSLVIDPVTPATLYAGTGRGVARSDNGGSTWTMTYGAVTTNGVAPVITVDAVAGLALDPQTPSTLYAGTFSGVFKSEDGGINWSLSSTGLTGLAVNTLAVDPQSPATVYAGTAGGVFISTNGAANWHQSLASSPVNALTVNPLTPVVVYAGASSGIFRTLDGGAHWGMFNNGLTNQTVQAVALNPVTPSILYAGTLRGLFKSTNSGTNWVAINSGLGSTNVTALAVDPVTPTRVIAGTIAGLFVSTDGGESWNPITNGLAVQNIGAVAVNPQAPATLYAGTRGLASLGLVDAFLTKFSFNSRTRRVVPVYSVQFGGTNDDTGWEVTVDPVGNAYVVGATASTNFPVVNSPAPLQTTNSGGYDAFVMVFNPDASALLYSLYLGGFAADYGYGVTIDPSGNAYVVGQTYSTNFPVLNALQPKLRGTTDAFLTKIVMAQPTLTVSQAGEDVILAWRAFAPEFGLESNTNLVSGSWVPVPEAPVLVGGWHTVTLAATNEASFFRLHKQ